VITLLRSVRNAGASFFKPRSRIAKAPGRLTLAKHRQLYNGLISIALYLPELTILPSLERRTKLHHDLPARPLCCQSHVLATCRAWLFFGVTTLGPEIYCFKTVTKEIGELNPNSGQIVRYRWHDKTLIGPDILVEGLHHNCHQVYFFKGKFYVVDTQHQRILVSQEQWRGCELHQILAEAEQESAL